MRQTVFAALIATAVAGHLRDRSYYEEKFYNWLQEHKVEVRSGEHFVHMLANFASNDDYIHAHNAGNSSYTLGHNQFSHLNEEEWRAFLQGVRRPATPEGAELHAAPADLTIPTSIDWVAKGAVTPVKNQGQCGSCWTFSTTGAIEGGYFNKYGVLKSFSEQDLVDCDTALGNNGCNGGWMDNAFIWIKRNGGIPTEADYPYVSGTTQKAGTCDAAKDAKKDPKSAPLGYKDIAYTAGQTSDNNFVSALALQPLSVAIQAGGKDFQLYTSGVFTGPCGATLDHGVLAVGYDADSYKVKNSWGPTWGEGGYIRLGRGASYNNGAGQCGVLSAASYPTF